MASLGEGSAKTTQHHDAYWLPDNAGQPHVSVNLREWPGWVLVLEGGRISFASAALASWLGYENPSALQGAAASAVIAGPLPQARHQGRLLVSLQSRNGAVVHAEMSVIEVNVGNNAGLLLWAAGQEAELPSRPQSMSNMLPLVAGLAHELNNPLTYLSLNLGFAERALTNLASSEAVDPATLGVARESLRVAIEGATRLSDIIRDLRASSRASEAVRAVDLRRAVEVATSLTRSHLRHKVTLRIEDTDVPEVSASEALLCQALASLLLAVVRDVRDGEAASHVLVIRLEHPAEGQVVARICLDPQGEPLALPAAEMAAIQGRLASFDGTLQTKDHGVLVELREATPRHASSVSSLPPPSRTSARIRVLVVGDESAIGEAIRHLLVHDADVEVVDNGRDAIARLLNDQNFDLILCDLMMPDMGGMDVHEAIRRARPGVEEKMVFLTGGPFTQRTRDFLRVTSNRTLDKPIDPSLLLALVRSCRR